MISKFLKFLNENINLSEMDQDEFNLIRDGFISNLDEYKNSLLSNIDYNVKTNKIEYKDFKKINIDKVLSQIRSSFGDDLVNQFNVESFLRKIQQIIDLKRRNTRKRIKEEFREYYSTLNQDRFNEPERDEDFFDKIESEKSIIPRRKYEGEKFDIHVELLKLQEYIVESKERLAVVFEGRDSAGKGSTIKTFTEHLNPRHFRVVALGMPTEEDKKNWFGRYEKHLPNPGEIVFFDRSWYNRAVVEPAMGYCTEDQYYEFIENVVDWEENLIKEGLTLIKFWFSITKEKQELRFRIRQNSPLKYWKFSPNDAKVIDKWDIITNYKNQMFTETSTRMTPWVIINSNDKRIGQLNAMRYVLDTVNYTGKNEMVCNWYPEVVNIIE